MCDRFCHLLRNILICSWYKINAIEREYTISVINNHYYSYRYKVCVGVSYRQRRALS